MKMSIPSNPNTENTTALGPLHLPCAGCWLLRSPFGTFTLDLHQSKGHPRRSGTGLRPCPTAVVGADELVRPFSACLTPGPLPTLPSGLPQVQGAQESGRVLQQALRMRTLPTPVTLDVRVHLTSFFFWLIFL